MSISTEFPQKSLELEVSCHSYFESLLVDFPVSGSLWEWKLLMTRLKSDLVFLDIPFQCISRWRGSMGCGSHGANWILTCNISQLVTSGVVLLVRMSHVLWSGTKLAKLNNLDKFQFKAQHGPKRLNSENPNIRILGDSKNMISSSQYVYICIHTELHWSFSRWNFFNAVFLSPWNRGTRQPWTLVVEVMAQRHSFLEWQEAFGKARWHDVAHLSFGNKQLNWNDR